MPGFKPNQIDHAISKAQLNLLCHESGPITFGEFIHGIVNGIVNNLRDFFLVPPRECCESLCELQSRIRGSYSLAWRFALIRHL